MPSSVLQLFTDSISLGKRKASKNTEKQITSWVADTKEQLLTVISHSAELNAAASLWDGRVQILLKRTRFFSEGNCSFHPFNNSQQKQKDRNTLSLTPLLHTVANTRLQSASTPPPLPTDAPPKSFSPLTHPGGHMWATLLNFH